MFVLETPTIMTYMPNSVEKTFLPMRLKLSSVLPCSETSLCSVIEGHAARAGAADQGAEAGEPAAVYQADWNQGYSVAGRTL